MSRPLQSSVLLTNHFSAFNIGIPNLPWVCGRDLAGTVICESSCSSRLRIGDRVLVPSTDYRDSRKAAFQEYAIATYYNAARIPPETSTQHGAAVGVAFVAAALALGVSFGLDFSVAAKSPGPDLIEIISNGLCGSEITADIRGECDSSRGEDRIRPGDWLVIWGGKPGFLSSCFQHTVLFFAWYLLIFH
jgi:NADPH:quinone reductase-like Zn-dependent oxidoreductase